MTTTVTPLPAGLEFHCEKCELVVPSDAPRIDGADCEFVARHKLAWFNPAETPAGQHVMAVAAWAMIHDAPLRAREPACHEYHRAFSRSRKAHFAASAVRQAMTAEQLVAAKAHGRDKALYL